MKSLLLFVYILTVLLISGLARANTDMTAANIEYFDQRLEVQGLLVQMTPVGFENSDNILYALIDDSQTVYYIKTLADLSSHVNSRITLKGIPLVHTAAPALSEKDDLGFREHRLNEKSNLVFATEVNSVPLL